MTASENFLGRGESRELAIPAKTRSELVKNSAFKPQHDVSEKQRSSIDKRHCLQIKLLNSLHHYQPPSTVLEAEKHWPQSNIRNSLVRNKQSEIYESYIVPSKSDSRRHVPAAIGAVGCISVCEWRDELAKLLAEHNQASSLS
ncbi:hypothetical protein J6590_047253 [Homalodisca vitripennis]|nr:hypothetical protein J6590_047253 [Homalodisca vitripennis]